MTKSKRKARAAKKDVKRAEKVLIIFKSKVTLRGFIETNTVSIIETNTVSNWNIIMLKSKQ
jgi:hypothetical protein